LRRSTYQPSVTLRVHTFFVMYLLRSSIILARAVFLPGVHHTSRRTRVVETTLTRVELRCVATTESLICTSRAGRVPALSRHTACYPLLVRTDDGNTQTTRTHDD
jgi:hypothetical protein